jgi:hypothetical protein
VWSIECQTKLKPNSNSHPRNVFHLWRWPFLQFEDDCEAYSFSRSHDCEARTRFVFFSLTSVSSLSYALSSLFSSASSLSSSLQFRLFLLHFGFTSFSSNFSFDFFSLTSASLSLTLLFAFFIYITVGCKEGIRPDLASHVWLLTSHPHERHMLLK